MIYEFVLRNFDCSLEFVFSLLLLQPFNFLPVSFACNFQDWGCIILREIDFLLKICWSIPCLHPSWKVHTWHVCIAVISRFVCYVFFSLSKGRCTLGHLRRGCGTYRAEGAWPRGCSMHTRDDRIVDFHYPILTCLRKMISVADPNPVLAEIMLSVSENYLKVYCDAQRIFCARPVLPC